jgi:hypothetical protein
MDDFVVALEAPVADAKRLVDDCRREGIDARLGRDDHCTKGCSPKLQLLVRPDDVEKLQALLRTQWRELVDREGTVDPAALAEGACPACGETGELDAEGACPGCGLVLG